LPVAGRRSSLRRLDLARVADDNAVPGHPEHCLREACPRYDKSVKQPAAAPYRLLGLRHGIFLQPVRQLLVRG